MNRIDEIEKRASSSALNQSSWISNYRSDVQYLLSKLEEAEKALVTTYDYIKQTDQELTKRHILKSLEQLRS